MLEAECILNCRLLTNVSSEAAVLDPLTPSDFLVGGRLTATMTPDESRKNQLLTDSRSTCKSQEGLRLQLWSRWHKECLFQLRSARLAVEDPETQLTVCDVAVMIDKARPCSGISAAWLVSFPDAMASFVAAQSCSLKRTVLYRPVQLLHHLEGDV